MTSFFLTDMWILPASMTVQQDDADSGWASTHYHRKFRRRFHVTRPPAPTPTAKEPCKGRGAA